jgi:hypothetical protein
MMEVNYRWPPWLTGSYHPRSSDGLADGLAPYFSTARQNIQAGGQVSDVATLAHCLYGATKDRHQSVRSGGRVRRRANLHLYFIPYSSTV